MSEAWAIIPASGTGSRFSPTRDKLLEPLVGIPVLVRTLQAFLDCPDITGIVMVTNPQNQLRYQDFINRCLPQNTIQWTLGGATRRDSVYQGLQALPDSASIVVIHDAARPLISPKLISQSIQSIKEGAAGAIAALPIYDTVKRVQAGTTEIQSTLDRNELWRAQTPQTFQRDLLLQAHRQIPSESIITDDAQLMEMAGFSPVQLIPGNEANLKITNATDIALAESLLTRQTSIPRL